MNDVLYANKNEHKILLLAPHTKSRQQIIECLEHVPLRVEAANSQEKIVE